MQQAGQQQTVVMQHMQQQPAVVTAQPAPGGASQNIRGFSSGLFNCTDDMGTCLKGIFCTPCLWCSIAGRLDENCCVPMFVQGGTVILRTKFRIMHGIKGTICDDCVVMTFCGFCAACQLAREMKQMGL